MIAPADCIERGVYELSSRNLLMGVYDGQGGFIGIRRKFGERYLFTEYHKDLPGTAVPIRLLGMLPDEIEVRETEDDPTRCSAHSRPCRWLGPPAPAPWVHDDGSELVGSDTPLGPGTYRPLFDYLEGRGA